MRTVIAAAVSLMVVSWCQSSVGAPFALPVRAKVAQTAADGKGWAVNGEIPVSLVQARAQLAAKASAAGWVHLHTIPLGRDRNLEAWSRGDKELTLMTWRIAAGKSGFSYGISSKAGAADAKPAVGRRRPDVQSRRPAGRAIPKGKK